ncbi:response regulator [Sulfurimonas sp.]|uniref:PAS domain-containing hybrid sensor histidine kinase/response regulator n=1 Tax=Sulfurimonas sp. TaxID=2022749 RepID=UPI0035675800
MDKQKANLLIMAFEAIVISISISSLIYMDRLYNELNIKSEQRRDMLSLADELRHSSDDLTHFARSYVITQDEKFKKQYFTTLDIRNGNKPRPLHYEAIYWDLPQKLRDEKHPLQESISLKDLMGKLPFSEYELSKLRESEDNSNDLVNLEVQAFNAMEGKFLDQNNKYTILKAKDRQLAIDLLYSKEYYKAKEKIMIPIDDFTMNLNERTLTSIKDIEKQVSKNYSTFLVFSFIFVIGNVFILLYLKKRNQKEQEEKIASYAMKQQKQRYENLLNLSSDGIFIMSSENGTLLEYSQQAKKMLGYTDEEMKTLKVFDWDKGIESIEQYHEVISNTSYTPILLEREHTRKDGSTYIASINAVKIRINDKEYMYASVRDITEEKSLKDKLSKSLEDINKISYEQNVLLSLFDKGDSVLFKWKNNSTWDVEYVSASVEKLLDYKTNEFLQKEVSYSSCIYEEDKSIVFDEVHEAIEKNMDFFKHEPYRVVTKNGNIKWILDYTVTQKDEDGNIVHFIGYLIDITDQKSIEKQLQRRIKQQNALLKIETTGLVQTKNRKFEWMNHAFERMLGYEKDELLGKETNIIYEDEQAYKDFGKGYQILKEKGVFTTELRCAKKDGTPITLLGSMTVINLDNLEAIGVFTDITPLKSTLKKLEEAKQTADKANKAKSEFLAHMSHEIRTPLNGTIGLTDLVLQTPLNHMQKEYLQKAQKSSNSLLHIINDILDYSKIEAGKLEIVKEKFFLNELLQNITHIFSYSTYEKGLEFNYTIDPNICNSLIGDNLRITQVLNNFIANAIKFTHEGFINVDIALKEKTDNLLKLEFSVKDSGIGIARENQEKLFKAFSQEDSSTTKKFGGTGLGLAISKQLVEMMGGKIFFRSDRGLGSIFGFTLDFEYGDENNCLDAKPNFVENKKFLVIDNNKIDRTYLVSILTSWGIKSYQAKDGEEAYEILKNENIDYLLVDWNIPKLDGLELLEKLQNENINIPNILMLTAHNKNKLLERAKKNKIDIDKILEKPYTPSSIYNILFDKENIQNSFDYTNTTLKLNTKKSALLVEDNDINQIVAKKTLEGIGFDVDLAKDGLEAVSMCKENIYNIIFMDLQMPNMDGFEASKIIREFDKEIPIIALSAAVMEKDKELTQAAGMNEHLSKPIEKNELFKVIKKYFDTKIETEDLEPENVLIKIEGIDMDKVLSDTQMSIKNLYTIYLEFAKNFKDIKITTNSYEKDSDELKNYIHKLKGASGNLRISAIYDLSKKINDNEEYQLINELIDITTEVCSEIENKLIPIVESATNTDIDIKELEQMIYDMIKDLDNYEYIESSRKNDLLKIIKVRVNDELFKQLSKSFDEGDNDKMIKQLETTLQSLQGEI